VFGGEVAAVVAHRVEVHPARGQQDLVEHLPVITADLGCACALVIAGVGADAIDGIGTERTGIDTIGRRGLVQPDERVGIVPVPARAMARIDQHDIGAAVSKQRIREGHAGGARADDQVVGVYRVQASPSSRM